MCSIDDGEITWTESHCNLSDVATCTRCGQTAVIVLRSDDALCRDCFLSRATHKFRAEFGKYRLVRDQEEILVAYSGGSCSSALVHLIQEGLSKKAMKKLRFNPVLLYVHECSALGVTTEEQTLLVMNVVKQMHRTGLRYHIYSLQQMFDTDLFPLLTTPTQNGIPDIISLVSCLQSNCDRLLSLLESAGSQTAKEALVCLLRRRLLVRIAQHHGKLIVGDTAVDLAVRLISHVTQGRGAHVANEMGFADNRDEDVTILRPMRDFIDMEVDTYNKLNQVIAASHSHSRSPKMSTVQNSIDALSRQFVLSLQESHSNTLSIICRTGQKLVETPSERVMSEEFKCCLCMSTIDTDSTAMSATLFSQSVCQSMHSVNSVDKISVTADTLSLNCNSLPLRQSQRNSEASPALPHRTSSVLPQNVSVSTIPAIVSVLPYGTVDTLCSSDSCKAGGSALDEDGKKNSCQTNATSKNMLTMEDLLSTLCYGCRLVVKNLTDIRKLPDSVTQQAVQQKRRRDMRSSIEDCLFPADS